MSQDTKRTLTDFHEAVNMTRSQIEKWLTSPESQAVGYKKDDSNESVGHHMGKVIVELLDKKSADLSEDDFKQMTKVVGYVHRHSKQRPDGDIKETPWRYSLMNWGHDPLKNPQ